MHACQSARQIFRNRAVLGLLSWRFSSTVSIGKHFEKATVMALKRLSFDLSMCGGPKDKGVDFRGTWRLKNSRVPVVGQCKKYRKRLGPRHVREMEGVLGRESGNTLGILVSERGFTKDAYNTYMGSSFSLALAVLQGCLDIDLDLRIMHNSTSAGLNTLNATGNHDVEEGKKNFSRKCSGFGECARETAKPYQDVLQCSGGNQISVPSIHENQTYQNQESKLTIANDQYISNVQSTMIAEVQQGEHVMDYIKHERTEFAKQEDEEVLNHGQITLFELNPAARRLIPNLFIGITYKGKHTRNPEVMWVEDNSVLHIESKRK